MARDEEINLEFYKFSVDFGDQIVSVLSEFNRLHNILIESSQDIAKIFRAILDTPDHNEKSLCKRLENIHMDEFAKIIVKDQFTQVFIRFNVGIAANSKKLPDSWKIH